MKFEKEVLKKMYFVAELLHNVLFLYMLIFYLPRDIVNFQGIVKRRLQRTLAILHTMTCIHKTLLTDIS